MGKTKDAAHVDARSKGCKTTFVAFFFAYSPNLQENNLVAAQVAL